MITGSDVLNVQKMLRDDGYSCPVNGVFDEATKNAVKMFQSKNGVSHINGVVDQETYNALINRFELPDGVIYYGSVINQSGLAIYSRPESGANIIDTLSYGDIIAIYRNDGDYMFTENGYILSDNVWTPDNPNVGIKGYVALKLGDEGPEVKVLQNALKRLGVLEQVTGKFNTATSDAIDLFQLSRGLERTGIVDESTWMMIHEAAGKLDTMEIGFVEKYNVDPGRYEIARNDIFSEISKYYVDISAPNGVTLKRTCNVYYKDGYVGILSTIADSFTGTFSLDDLSDAFIYNIKHGYPEIVEYVIYPYGHTPRKYVFTFIE